MPHVELPQAEFKVVILGDTNTGKTSLVLRFAEGYFRETSRSPTVGAFFITKRIQIQGITCKIQIWDTAGQTQFRPMAKMYYSNAAAAVLCYDVSNRQSFEAVKFWLDELQRNVPAGNIVMCICAQKSDQTPHVVPQAEVEELAHNRGAIFVQTSAKNNTNVNLLFKRVAERVLLFQKTIDGSSIPVSSGARIDASGNVVKHRNYRDTSGAADYEEKKEQPWSHEPDGDFRQNSFVRNGSGRSFSTQQSKRRDKRTRAPMSPHDEKIPQTKMCGVLPSDTDGLCRIM